MNQSNPSIGLAAHHGVIDIRITAKASTEEEADVMLAVTVDDVMKVVAVSSRFDAFALAEHMLSGNLHEGLRVAAGLKRMDTPIPMMLGALLKELKTTEAFRLAMRAGEQEAIAFRRLNIWFNRQNTIREAARRLNTRKLFEAFKMLALIDRQSKGRAAGDPWQSLDTLLLQLSSRS